MTEKTQHANIPAQSELEKIVCDYGFQKKGARNKHEWSEPKIEWKTFVSGDKFRFYSSLPTRSSILLKQNCNQCGSIRYNRVYYTSHKSNPKWHWELYRGNARIVYSPDYENSLCSSKKRTVVKLLQLKKEAIVPKPDKINEEIVASKPIITQRQETMKSILVFEQKKMREAKRRIHNLIEEYMHVLAIGKMKSFNEERVRIAFVIPLLEALGWKDFYETGRAGLADENFVLKSNGKTKVLVEVENPNKSLDEYRVTRDGLKSYARLAIQHAWDAKASWVILTNFEETRLYSSKVRKPEDGLVWKIRFTEYESRFDELTSVSRMKVDSGFLGTHETKIEKPLELNQITDLLKKNGPLTRKQILEKLGLSSSYKFPWYVRKFGSRRRKIYFLEGQEDLAKEKYENMLKPRKRTPQHPTLAYQKEYFLNLLHLKRPTSFSPAADGTPFWWERRSNRKYTCSACERFIEKGERYVGRRKLNPGMRGIYGYRGTYSKDYYHILCLLRAASFQTMKSINYMQSEISGFEKEIAAFKDEVISRIERIEACQILIQLKRGDYDRAIFWRKFGKWFGSHYTSWSKNNEISRLKKEMVHIENIEIPKRKTQIIDLKDRIGNLEAYLGEIQTRIQELDSHQRTKRM